MNRLKELRKEKGVSLREVATSVDIAESQLSFYENGKREPREKETWVKLADYFGVSVGYLMGVSNIRVSDKKALEVAREIYFSYLSDENLDDETKTAIRYFNNDDLDNILRKAMRQFLAIPTFEQDTRLQSIEKTKFLYDWLEGYLVDMYRREVKTNQNLITNTYYNIPPAEDINEYGCFLNEIQMPVRKDFNKSFGNEIFPEKVQEELERLMESDTILVAYTYENSIDGALIDDINEILDDTRSKLLNLKDKYPDKPSEIEQVTTLISKDENTSLWTRIGSCDSKDELNLSEITKQIFVQLGSEVMETMEKHLEENNIE